MRDRMLLRRRISPLLVLFTFHLAGLGMIEARAIASSGLISDAGFPKYARPAASAPNIPLPHSAMFR